MVDALIDAHGNWLPASFRDAGRNTPAHASRLPDLQSTPNFSPPAPAAFALNGVEMNLPTYSAAVVGAGAGAGLVLGPRGHRIINGSHPPRRPQALSGREIKDEAD
jgi:hypothetical protein